MIVSTAKLFRVFRLVRDLEEQMVIRCVDGQRTPVPWQHVVDTVEYMTQIRITVTRVQEQADGTRANVKRWSDNTALVTVQRGMPEDLDNFTVIKEAMHPLIDEPGDMSPDGVSTLRKLVTSSYFGNGDGQHDMDPILQSEHLATIAAAAVVVPRRLRSDYHTAIAASKTTIGKIALELNAPEHIVSLALDASFDNQCTQALAEPQEA